MSIRVQLLKVSARSDVEVVGRHGTNVAAADASRLNLHQHVAVADRWNGHIANLDSQRLHEDARPIRCDGHGDRFLGVYSDVNWGRWVAIAGSYTIPFIAR